MNNVKPLTIGEVARCAGVGVETVRFYERKGLIDEPPRTESGYSQYPSDAIERVKLILQAKELGFSLREIKEIISYDVKEKSQRKCDGIRNLVEDKITDLDERITSLVNKREILNGLLGECCGEGEMESCPVLTSLGCVDRKEFDLFQLKNKILT